MTQPPIPEGETVREAAQKFTEQDSIFEVWGKIDMQNAFIAGAEWQKAQAGGEPLYTKEQILESVRTKLHEVYGGLYKDQNGRKINTPYTVLGILHDAIPDFPLPECQRPNK